MDENKIVIVSDDSDIIKFDDVTIRHDTVSRTEVAQVESQIAELESQKVAIDERIVELKAKLLYAKKVIDIADAAKAETDAEQNNEVPANSNDEIQETEIVSEED